MSLIRHPGRSNILSSSRMWIPEDSLAALVTDQECPGWRRKGQETARSYWGSPRQHWQAWALMLAWCDLVEVCKPPRFPPLRSHCTVGPILPHPGCLGGLEQARALLSFSFLLCKMGTMVVMSHGVTGSH